MKYLVRKDPDGVFRAYQGGTVPVYLGGVTAEACRKRVLDYYLHAEVEIEETVKPAEENMKILIFEDGLAPLAKGHRFMAYRAGHPLTTILVGDPPAPIGGPTVEDCIQAVRTHYPDAELMVPAHEHHPASVEPAQPPPGLRRTGVFQIETCRCGMKRQVWITTFTVDAGAWQ